MKKNIILLIVFPIIFFSCKKEHTASISPAGKKYKISFNVSNFIEQKGAFSLKHPGTLSINSLVDPKDYLDVLYYIAYDTDGRFAFSTITQDSTDSNMGTITDSLPNGTYPIYIFAGKKGLKTYNAGYLVDATYGYGSYNWQDTFWAGFNLTVNNGNVTQSVTLKRTVAKLELQVLDNIPANANTISMKIYPEVLNQDIGQGYNDGETPMDTTYASVLIPASAKGHPNFTFDRLTGGSANLTVSIICKDASNNILGSATATNVGMERNVKTILSGKLFTGSSTSNSQTFTLKADTAWGSSIPFSF